MIGDTAVERRQTCYAGKPRRAPLGLDHHAVLRQFTRDKACYAGREFLTRLHGNDAATVMLQHEPDVRTGHRETAHNILAGGIFGARRAQELAPGGNLAKELLYPNSRPRRQRSGAIRHGLAMIDGALPALAGVVRPALDRQPRHRPDRWQSLAAETQRGDLLDMFVGQLRCRVTFER